MVTIKYATDSPFGAAESDLVGPIVIENVFVGGDVEPDPVINIRIREEASDEDDPVQYAYVIEYEYKCTAFLEYEDASKSGMCGASNWILFNTDPSEYRCVKCTNYL